MPECEAAVRLNNHKEQVTWLPWKPVNPQSANTRRAGLQELEHIRFGTDGWQ